MDVDSVPASTAIASDDTTHTPFGDVGYEALIRR
jgi:hypothetical protein